ncbi:hypothetical protein U1Q18_005983, partial [Sarracenia purpurea var. burkii]
ADLGYRPLIGGTHRAGIVDPRLVPVTFRIWVSGFADPVVSPLDLVRVAVGITNHSAEATDLRRRPPRSRRGSPIPGRDDS